MVWDVKAVSQHTGFALDHLIPQQQRDLATKTERNHSSKVQAKALVSITKVESVATSPTHCKTGLKKILEKVIVTPSLLFNCMPAAGLWSYTSLELALIWLVAAAKWPHHRLIVQATFLPLSTYFDWVLSKALYFVLLSQVPWEAFKLYNILHIIIKTCTQAIHKT